MSDSTVHFLSGAGGGVFATAITYPLQNLATRLQLKKDGSTNTFLVVKELLESEKGIKSLYDGIGSALVGVAVSNGMFYWYYECLKKTLETINKRPLGTAESLLVGAIAGAVTSIASNPIWVINTRMAAPDAKNKNVGVLHTIQDIIEKRGIFGFFDGVIPGLILVSNPSIQYMISEKLKVRFLARRSGGKLTDLDFFTIGLIGKFFSSTITYPLILLKTRLQSKDSKLRELNLQILTQMVKEKGLMVTVLQILNQMVGEKGFMGLFQGYLPRISQSILTAALLFFAKERLFSITVSVFIFLRLRQQKAITK